MSLLNFRTRDYSKIALQLPVFSFIPFLFYLVKGESTARQCCHVTFSVHLREVIGVLPTSSRCTSLLCITVTCLSLPNVNTGVPVGWVSCFVKAEWYGVKNNSAYA